MKRKTTKLDLKPSRRLVQCLQANVRELVAKVELLERQAKGRQQHLAVRDQQVLHLRQDCVRLHEVLEALIRRAYGIKSEAISAERLLPRLHYTAVGRYGPGGSTLVPARERPPRKGR